METHEKNDPSRIYVKRPALKFALAGIFTALVMMGTLFFGVTIPASGGYFNLGEGIIYLAALLFGPFVGGFSGGVGAALADLVSGYGAWAPGTFLIKFAEGWLVGHVFFKLKEKAKNSENIQQERLESSRRALHLKRIKVLVSGAILAGIELITGYHFIPEILWVWILVAILILITAALAVFWFPDNTLHLQLSISIGAFVMVVGYLLYGVYVFTGLDNILNNGTWEFNYGAIAEVPFNIVQCMVGLGIASIVYITLDKAKILQSLGLSG